MSDTVTHQMMMLRPLQAGLSGYARLQGEPGRQLVQINLRGLTDGEMRVFWYAGEGLVREVGRCGANARGEAALSAEVPADAAAPRRLMALLITDGGDRPKPLAIGLCTAQSAGSLMDAKNALLALCDKLGRVETAPEPHKPGVKAAVPDRAKPLPKDASTGKAPSVPTKPDAAIARPRPEAVPHVQPSQLQRQPKTLTDDLPREVFLPAIEARRRPERRRYRREGGAEGTAAQPVSSAAMGAEQREAAKEENCSGNLPHQRLQEPLQQYMPAIAPASATTASLPQPQKPTHSPSGLPADRLPTLQWPAPFQSLAAHFDHNLPLRLMNWPGWRFVHVKESRLWIGYRQQDGCIRQVAYALPPDAQPPAGQPFRLMQTATGEQVQLLVLDA